MVRKEAVDTGFIKWFSELSNKDVQIAGGKGASLAEMYNNHFPIPPGFVVTAQAYGYFIQKTGLGVTIQSLLDRLNTEDTKKLEETSKKIRALIEDAELPEEMTHEIIEAYDILGVEKQEGKRGALDVLSTKGQPFVAVRSSATTEDLADASFAGQQDSFLGVRGHEDLITKVKMCMSSLFTARAIYYRAKKRFSTSSALLSVVIQKMINSEKSGVMFSRNPVKNDKNVVVDAVWGLGEGIVSGRIVPDHYVVNRNEDIVELSVSDKKVAIVRASSGTIEEIKLKAEQSHQQVLTGYEIKRLAQYGMQLEDHYKKPQDIEFAIANGEIYIVQSRPITTKAQEITAELHGTVLLSGLGASPGVGVGTVRIVRSMDDLDLVKKGDVLVTTMTNPDMVVSMQRAAAIVTDEGGVTSHAAIVSREMGIPAVVGTRLATEKLKDGQLITVDGSTGRVIDGKGTERKVEIKHIVPTRTKIKVIVDLPDYAERAALSGSHAVGLVRLEGIIGSSGKHPMWYVTNKRMREYVATLSAGLKKIAMHFNEVWVRTSDIRSDEYDTLEGAPHIKESNPMLGDHGVRFSVKHPDILEAEIVALKEVADEFSDKKFGIMLPQVISVDEVVTAQKLARGIKLPSNVVFGIMVETPAAVQTIEELCATGIKFVSFGTNDLTQFTLALDRNNENVQHLYNEMHPAVLNSLKHVISVCKNYGVQTSICGQAGSRPEMASFLVKCGIDSLSVNADAAYLVSTIVQELEAKQPVESEPQELFKRAVSQNPAVSYGSKKPIKTTMMEEEVLKALDDEYAPGMTKLEDIPALNDAIPVDSEFN
jgi:pyruvate,water dikinase